MPPSKAATTARPSTGANPNKSALHSVRIGLPPASETNRSCNTIFSDPGPRCTYPFEKSGLVTKLPDHVSFAEGATLGVPAMTAHRAVFVAGPVQGKTLLITGGAGAVGHYAVQLASWAGGTVITTVSSAEKAERAQGGGAAHVINYRAEDVAARVLDITNDVGVDHIAEVDFGGNLAATMRCLRVNGSVMIYASNGDREPKLPVRDMMQKNLVVYAMSLAGVPHPDRKRAQTDIAAWTATPGRILSVAARFALYETAGAHKTVEAGGKVGTVIVEPQR